MNKFKSAKYERTIYLSVIVFVGLLLRFYKLGFQSLWLDELYTFMDCDPSISWHETLTTVLALECKSPLYYFIVKFLFIAFGYTDIVARVLSVVAGIAGIYAMYFLGKEIFNTRTGLIAALFTSLNYFHIYYSQEARGYIFLFLFTVLSFLFFIRTLKTLSLQNAIWYGLTSLLSLHIHTFAILVIIAQALILSVYCFIQPDKQIRIKQFKRFGLSFLIIFLGFLPLINMLISTTQITESWIPMPNPGYFIDYFFEFFGNSKLLKPILLVIVIFYLAHVFTTKKEENSYEGLSFNFTLISISLVIIFLIPYVYSILKIPALVSRYLINALPLILLMLAAGINSIKNNLVRNLMGVSFVICSITELFIVKDYYNVPIKTQFREMTEYVKLHSEKPYLIINEKTWWQNSYYTKLFGLTSEVKAVNKEDFVSSILIEKKQLGFWIVGAHNDKKLSSEKARLLETRFLLAQSKDFLDAWAQLYLPVGNENETTFKLDYRNFKPQDSNKILGDSVVTIWDGNARVSNAIDLPTGTFEIKLLSNGTPYQKVFPHLNIYVNDSLLGNYFAKENFEASPSLTFINPGKKDVIIKIIMDNDANNATQSMNAITEDRNAFIKAIYFLKK